MPAPSSSLATLRPDLGGSLEEFSLAMDRQGFIAHRVMPVFETQAQAGTFGRIPLEQLLRNRETRRASGSGYTRGNWQFEPDSFATKEHGAEEPVDDRDAQIYADYFDAEIVSAELALDAVMRNAERRVADMLFNATIWTGSNLAKAVDNEWDDVENATPVEDVEFAVQKVWENSGLWPNALIINRKVFRNLRNCEEIRDRIRAAGAGTPDRAGLITTSQLAEVFDLPFILVAGGAQNLADEGKTAQISQIWSDEYAMVARIATTNNIKEPCLGRTFHWGADGSQIGGTVESYRDEATRSNIIRVRHEVDEKLLYVQAGFLLSNITTAE